MRPARLTRAHVRTLRRAATAAAASFAPVLARLVAEVRAELRGAPLDPRALRRSAWLRDNGRAFVVARLRLHGFAPAGHGCWSRGVGLPMREARALEACDADVDAALRARGLGDLLPRHQGEQRDEQAGERERGAKVHGASSTAGLAAVRSEP